MATILIYDRPFTSRFTKQYRALFGDRCRIVYISDFRFRDDVGFISRQYHYLRRSNADDDYALDYEVIARRCRYLRLLDPTLQRRLINSAWLAISEVFERYEPDGFVGLPIDNYHLDLIDQYCIANGIFTTNPVQSFLPDRTRICRRGEYNNVRDVSPMELERYRDLLLRRDFRPTWLSKPRARGRLARMYAREFAKVGFFKLMKTVKCDPYSFHYNGVYPMGAAINTNSTEVLRIPDLFEKNFASVAERARAYASAVFLPLQFSPESSLDYNIQDSRFSWYGRLLNMILEHLPADALLIVKEHPDMFGYRHYDFFDRFRGRENVVLIDVNITVQQVFDIAEYVLVTGGASTGAEAVVKGKTVISLGGAFYGGTAAIHEIINFDDVPKWPRFLKRIDNRGPQLDDVVRRMLSNTLIGPYDFVRISRQKVPAARQNVAEIMNYVICAIESVDANAGPTQLAGSYSA
jgi:hypothetical protein